MAKYKTALLSSAPNSIVGDLMPRMTQKTFDNVMRMAGLEMGCLAIVYDEATRNKRLMRVTPEYWQQQFTQELK